MGRPVQSETVRLRTIRRRRTTSCSSTAATCQPGRGARRGACAYRDVVGALPAPVWTCRQDGDARGTGMTGDDIVVPLVLQG